MNLSDLEGRTYGPTSWTVNADAVHDFALLTGVESGDHAPPGFAAAALFAVAPDLLAELYELSVIHGEQSFTWAGPIEIGATYQVAGEVTKVRERGGVHFMTFEIEAGDVLTGKALFLVSGESNAAGEALEQTEPDVKDDGSPAPGQLSASRADLVRYASATRDWNPVHWDHEAAVVAGFPCVVVHGLLQAGWALSAYSGDDVTSARFRFRAPLSPATPVSVSRDGGNVSLSDVDTEYLTATIKTS